MNAGNNWSELLLGEHVIGESPRWSAKTSELVWVDVFPGTLERAVFDPSSGAWTTQESKFVGSPLTSVAPLHEPSGGWVVATGSGLARVSREGAIAPFCELLSGADYPTLRTNDMVADSAGRLLVGLLDESRSVPRAGLVSVEPDGTSRMVVTGVIAANGVGLSPDESVVYLVDSIPKTLTAYKYDPATGDVGAGTRLATWEDDGTFDGLAVDAEGNIWVAIWDAGLVCQFSRRGDLIATFPTPVARPTALAFAGSEGDRLVLTTARLDLATPESALPPRSEGRLYEMLSEVSGPPAATVGAPTWTR